MEELDELKNQTNQLYENQMQQQQNIVNTSTQQAIDEYERQKQKTQEEVDKTNKALYTDYQKQINPYGAEAENLYEQGLGKSGLAETTKASYYNTYQNARTSAQNNANTIKADFDAQIAKARQSGDLQMAQAALQMYQQKVNDMYNLYNLSYQKQRDELSQSNWQKEYERAMAQDEWNKNFNQQKFDYNKAIDERNYQYQRERDAIADEQWQQQYELSKKNSESSRSYGGSSGGYYSDSTITPEDTENSKEEGYNVTVNANGNTIIIEKPDGTYASLKITPEATNEQVLAWGRQNGVDLNNWL